MKALFYLTFLGIFFISCTKERLEANGNIRTEVRNPGTFSSVSSSGSKRIHISYGHVYEIELRGSSNLIPRYKTRIHNNTLSVGYENVNVVDDDLEVYITMPQFEGARLSGSGKIYVSGLFPYREHCDFDISGSGDITVRDEFEVEDLDINISGSGNVNADKILSSNADVNKYKLPPESTDQRKRKSLLFRKSSHRQQDQRKRKGN